MRRCSRCDQEGVVLVEKDYHYLTQPKGEVVDLYKCTFCGEERILIIEPSPNVLYD